MRRRGRVDGNHAEVVSAFRRCGATVFSTAGVGSGYPDLTVGIYGMTHLVEIKDGDLAPSKRRLTTDEKEWHASWAGEPVEIVESATQAAYLVWTWRRTELA